VVVVFKNLQGSGKTFRGLFTPGFLWINFFIEDKRLSGLLYFGISLVVMIKTLQNPQQILFSLTVTIAFFIIAYDCTFIPATFVWKISP